jgi:hypothetical protein
VEDAAGGKVAAAVVGRVIAVFVGCAGGNVGVLKGVASESDSWACTVKAACVKTAFGSSVGWAFEGKLQAERNNASNKPKVSVIRMDLNMFLLLKMKI